MHTRALILYARPPVLGRVKSRLQPALSPEEGLDLYRAMLADSLERMTRLSHGLAVPFVSWSEPYRPSGDLANLLGAVTVEVQRGDDLGERMATTLQTRLQAGFTQVVFIGSDSPNLPLEYIRKAFGALQSDDIVLGPAADGGYCLLGCRRMHPNLFQAMPWGTEKVLKITRQRIKSSNISYRELPAWYDVDSPPDVARLWQDLQHMSAKGSVDLPRRTFELLAKLVPRRPDLAASS